MRRRRSLKEIAQSAAVPVICIVLGVGLILLSAAIQFEQPEVAVSVNCIPLSPAGFFGMIGLIGLGLVIVGVIYPYNALRNYVHSKQRGSYRLGRRSPFRRFLSGWATGLMIFFGSIGSIPALVGGLLVYGAISGGVGARIPQPTDVPLGLGLVLVGIALPAGVVALIAYFE